MDDRCEEVLRLVSRSLWIITAQAGDEKSGLVATFVNSASLVREAPRMIVGIARHHYTWDLIRRSGAFAAHLFDEANQHLAWRFGLATGRDQDKFATIPWRSGPSGSPLLDEALAWLDCEVEEAFDIGDRTIYLGSVVEGGLHGDGIAMTQDRLFAIATPEQLAKMTEDRHRDAARDAKEMNAWRERRDRSGRVPRT